MAVMSGAKYILKHPNSSPLKHLLSFDFAKKDQHTIEDRLDMVRKIGGKAIYKEMDVALCKTVSIRKKFEYLKGAVGFQIGAANVYKMWPIDRFIDLAGKIIRNEPGQKIVITGIKNEYNLAEKIVKAHGKDSIINMCGKCSMGELPFLVNQFKVLVTNDTGTLHLAIALKVPTISLFSPTSSKGIGPYQDNDIHTVIQKQGGFIQKYPKKERKDTAMKMISVEEVFNAYKDRF
jgi:ADP-heptose:LPS heptosyltransferase